MPGDHIVHRDPASGGHRRGKIGPGFDLVGDDGIGAAPELFHAPDLDHIGAGPGDLCAHGVQEVCQVHDVGLLGGVFDDGGALSQDCGDHDVHGGANGDHIQADHSALHAV